MSDKYKLNKPHSRHSNGLGYITKYGHTMTQFDIVQDLINQKNIIAEVEDKIDCLARKCVRLEEALKIANDNLQAEGLFGVIPKDTNPSFKESKNFYKKVANLKEQ